MNKDHIKGTWKETKGRVKEELGHATGNTATQSEGVKERVVGKIQKGLGDVKDAVKHGIDKVLDTSHSKKAS